MEIRKAKKSDVLTLVKLRKDQLVDEGLKQENNIDKELYAYFDTGLENGTFIAWIAEDSGKIIATSGICFYQLPPTYKNPSGQIAYITNMYTKPAYRRQGIADKLLMRVINEATAQGCNIARLHASAQARSLYEKHGFAAYEDNMQIELP